jgi:tRNA-binding EMAP/Myf-like protein
MKVFNITDRVIFKEENGTLKFADPQFTKSDGTLSDQFCRVVIDGSENTQGEWCRASQLTELLNEPPKEVIPKSVFKDDVDVGTYFALDVRHCLITEVDDILKKPKKEFDKESNPVKGYKLTIDTGHGIRTVVTNIVNFSKESLLNKITPFILNFPVAEIRGIQSHGMIFMVQSDELIIGDEIGQVVI